jgi:hypothetical protein
MASKALSSSSLRPLVLTPATAKLHSSETKTNLIVLIDSFHHTGDLQNSFSNTFVCPGMIGGEEENVASRDPISKSVVDAGRRHIFYANKRGERFNITAVHRMNIHYLRKRIMDETMSILKKGETDDGNSQALTSLIQNYCLFSDYNFLSRCRSLIPDPYLGAAVKDRELMRDTAYRDWVSCLFHLNLKSNGLQPDQMVSYPEDHLMPELPGGPWDYPSASRTRKERYALAILGGIILNAPLILMVLVPGTVTSLVTVPVCTMIFAVAAAYFSPTKLPLELLAATAAYATVLVVFVSGTRSG